MIVFLLRSTIEDRDAVAYIDTEALRAKPTAIDGHYSMEGPCYSKSFKNIDYNDVETALSKEYFEKIMNPDDKNLDDVIAFLESKENTAFAEKIFKDEKEIMKHRYRFTDKEVDKILTEFNDGYTAPKGRTYRDRGVIEDVYRDKETFAKEYIDEYDELLAYENAKREELIEVMINENYGRYTLLDDGRVAVTN